MPRLCPARRSLAECRGRATGPASLERPSTHRRNKSVHRVQPQTRAGRPGRQGGERSGSRPGAGVVKAFNSIVTVRFNEGPIRNGGRRVIFVSGDHPEPTEFVKSVIEGFGFVPVYLGDLATGGRLQQAGAPLAGRDLVDFGSL